MKHLFIVNPIAGGRHNDYRNTIDTIESLMADSGKDYEIYITSGVWDAVEKVKKESEQGSELRVYACGGDGTFNECVNGAAGFDNASVTVFPCGTGN
ncbi:MAG: acylglycerol kinase family protein, partial [Oscillospiraceae bacterium]|nr:acylglycerol kinase family protein [Oscillospiraceae bacterium]